MSSSVNLYGVISTAVKDVWTEVKPLVERGLEYANGKYTPEDIRQSLESRDMQLWLAINGAIKACAVTQIVNFPRQKVCLIVLVAGQDVNDWLHFGNEIERWAKENGCEAVEAFARPGWERITDYKRVHVVIRKNL